LNNVDSHWGINCPISLHKSTVFCIHIMASQKFWKPFILPPSKNQNKWSKSKFSFFNPIKIKVVDNMFSWKYNHLTSPIFGIIKKFQCFDKILNFTLILKYLRIRQFLEKYALKNNVQFFCVTNWNIYYRYNETSLQNISDFSIWHLLLSIHLVHKIFLSLALI
jgi:hypothetical protein